jgi:hypothetical protein
MKKYLATALFIALATPSVADRWVNLTPNQSDRAFYGVESDGMRLKLGCFRRDKSLGFTLIGGNTTLPNVANLMIWIELPNGRTGRYPMDDVQYLGGSENALIGKLQLGQQGKQFFASGRVLFIDGPPGNEIFAPI